jgi:hypothetical protein
MAQPPLCKLCSTHHWFDEPHAWETGPKPVHAPSPKVTASPDIMSPKVVDRPSPKTVDAVSPKTVLGPSPKKGGTGYERNKRWREKHLEAYRAGQRELMRKRYAGSQHPLK